MLTSKTSTQITASLVIATIALPPTLLLMGPATTAYTADIDGVDQDFNHSLGFVLAPPTRTLDHSNLAQSIIISATEKGLAGDLVVMVLFFIIYGMLPRLLGPGRYRYAKDKASSPYMQVLGSYIWPIVAMSLVCVFWKVCMNPNLPSTEDTSFLSYVIYYLLGGIVTDVHFYAVHKLMHSNKFLYRHIHCGHHAITSSEMEALDFLDQHPFEMWLNIMPLAYTTYLVPIVPAWYAFVMVYVEHGMGLAAHSMYNFYDTSNPLFYAFLPFSSPLIIVSIATRMLGLSNILSSPGRHYLHHKDPEVNFGLMYTFMDRWMGTERSSRDKSARSIPQTRRHEMAILFLLIQAAILTTTGSMYAAQAIYGVNLVVEMANPRTNAFLRYVHHPLALLLVFVSFHLQLQESAIFIVLSNLVQLPNFVALLQGRRHVLAAAVVTPIKLAIGAACMVQLLSSASSSPLGVVDKFQMITIGFGSLVQVKGGFDLARKGGRKTKVQNGKDA